MLEQKNNKKLLITIWDPTNSKTTLGILDMSPLLNPSEARDRRALASIDFYTNLDPLEVLGPYGPLTSSPCKGLARCT